MKRKLFLITLGGICCMSIGLSTWLSLTKTKLAYVRSQELVSRYRGTLDAKNKFEEKRKQILSNVDSLEVLLNHAKENYLPDKLKMSQIQKAEREQEINRKEMQLNHYRSLVEQKIAEEDSKMMEGVLGQVNSFIEEYAKINGYDVILGTTLSGSLLYAKDDLDITEELLRELNQKFDGK